jgi:hypothetical protein
MFQVRSVFFSWTRRISPWLQVNSSKFGVNSEFDVNHYNRCFLIFFDFLTSYSFGSILNSTAIITPSSFSIFHFTSCFPHVAARPLLSHFACFPTRRLPPSLSTRKKSLALLLWVQQEPFSFSTHFEILIFSFAVDGSARPHEFAFKNFKVAREFHDIESS